jgi:peptide/nickel transport system permease protein
MGALWFITRRLLQMGPVVLGLTAVVFLMIHLVPGDPARTLLGPQAPESVVAQLRHAWGLDRPLPAQFALFLGRLSHADFGQSLANDVPARELIAGRVAPTLVLLLYASVLSLLLTVPLGCVAAVYRGKWPDHLIQTIPLIGLGMPSFWLAILLILLLSLGLGWFPVGGYGIGWFQHLRAMFLPSLTVALAISVFTVRSLRASLIEVLDSDYIVTAQSKGITNFRVLVGHALRNAIIPTLTVLGVKVGWLVGNSIIVEKVFAIPGLGSLMFDAIQGRDFPVVQALTLIFGLIVVLVDLFTDIARAALDPRVGLS